MKQTGALVGFIGAMTNLHFCESCNKMRLTADGKVRPCLGDHGELDLRAALRATASDEAVRECCWPRSRASRWNTIFAINTNPAGP